MSDGKRGSVVSETESLRDRIAAAIRYADEIICDETIDVSDWYLRVADAVIGELDTALLDFGLWLAEEITGRQMTRIDMESCITDWKDEQ